MNLIAWLIGYMTEAQAKAEGFTHSGSFLGMPAWLGDVEGGIPTVSVKWAPLDWLLPLWAELFKAIVPAGPGFPFRVLRKIN